MQQAIEEIVFLCRAPYDTSNMDSKCTNFLWVSSSLARFFRFHCSANIVASKGLSHRYRIHLSDERCSYPASILKTANGNEFLTKWASISTLSNSWISSLSSELHESVLVIRNKTILLFSIPSRLWVSFSTMSRKFEKSMMGRNGSFPSHPAQDSSPSFCLRIQACIIYQIIDTLRIHVFAPFGRESKLNSV